MLLITGPQRARSKINWARAVLEPAIVLAGAPEKETGPVVALEPEIGPVEAGRERARAAAVELERGRVVAVPGRDLVVAVALRTKSATGAHRQDLVRLLTAEASVAAVVETSLAPAAVEAVKAWVAVDSAAVAVAVAAEAVAADAVVAAAEDKQIISMREN
jgi:hypothetical protein